MDAEKSPGEQEMVEEALREALTDGTSASQCAYARHLVEQGRYPEAADHFRAALEKEPNSREALRGLADVLSGERRFAEAAELLWKAVAVRPDDTASLSALGLALISARKPEEAVVVLRQAVRLMPAEPRLFSNLGLALADAGRFDEAEAAYGESLIRDPMNAPTHSNLAGLYLMMGRHAEAATCAEMALKLQPAHAGARRNRAIARLAQGDFARGWEEYDWRAWGVPQPPDPCPLWRGPPLESGGESLAGKRILLMGRHGLGDTIQFVRYAPMIKALGAHTILECPAPLLEVMESAEGVDQVAVMSRETAPPAADYCVALMDLPRLFATRESTIPAEVPYLGANLERVASWRQRLGSREAMLTVGIAWQGNPHHEWDRFRSIRLARFEPLLHPGVRLISLQRGPGLEQVREFQALTGGRLEVPLDPGAPDQVGDLAALMELMDLVVTVDSATAHLAGALGRRTWVALAQASDWRWMTGREETPWYPTMRLFRQRRVGDWDELFRRMRELLADML